MVSCSTWVNKGRDKENKTFSCFGGVFDEVPRKAWELCIESCKLTGNVRIKYNNLPN